jgi:hypothetical protein
MGRNVRALFANGMPHQTAQSKQQVVHDADQLCLASAAAKKLPSNPSNAQWAEFAPLIGQ